MNVIASPFLPPGVFVIIRRSEPVFPSMTPPQFKFQDSEPEAPLAWKVRSFGPPIPPVMMIQPYREPDFCQCGPPCPGPGPKRCRLCGLGFPACLAGCSELGGHLRACPNKALPPKIRPKRRPLAERKIRRQKHAAKVKARAR